MLIGSKYSNMQAYIQRKLEKNLAEYQKIFPVVAIIGPRQCGKSTMVKHISNNFSNAVYLDLEIENDLNRLMTDPAFFLRNNIDKTIIIDEVQQFPEVFSVLRPIVDEVQKTAWVILLGSASPVLIKNSSETLAGRIGYLELTPFLINEVKKTTSFNVLNFWLKGGFPKAYLLSDKQSYIWRNNFVTTFIERDIPLLNIKIPALTLKRFLRMMVHFHGQVLNSSQLGSSLGVSNHTARQYVDIFEQTFILRTLQPYLPNLNKRLIKSPKVYIRDSGIFHSLLQCPSFDDLMAHPAYGSSWEGFVIEQVITAMPDWTPYFFRTRTGVEIDLILEKGTNRIAIECKVSTAPKPTRGFYQALDELKIDKAYIIAPVDSSHSLNEKVMVTSLEAFLEK